MATSFQFTINKRSGQNQYYEEPIGEGVRPLEMMRIPSGSFLMGSPEDELERFAREGPQHKVALSQFFLAKVSHYSSSVACRRGYAAGES
jgi:formylglycine-generating enzyme required for sulfatase activity